MPQSGVIADDIPPQNRPYPPSWVDRLQTAVRALPAPWWASYLLLAVGLYGAVALVLWRSGVYGRVGFHPMQVWLPLLVAYMLLMTDALDRTAWSAMQRFKPAFSGTEAEFENALYKMTTLPAWPTWIFTALLSSAFVPIGLYEMAHAQSGGFEQVPALELALDVILSLVTSAFLYHVFHQLREIHRLHRDSSNVQLGYIRPMHAMSEVAGLTALAVLGYTYGWFLAQPGDVFLNPVSLGEYIFDSATLLIVFIWPLWGAHRRLVEAKEAALHDVAQRRQRLLARLHGDLDQGAFGDMTQLNHALQAVSLELADLIKVPTWPWASGTLRSLLGAVLLPVALWLIQLGLTRILAQ